MTEQNKPEVGMKVLAVCIGDPERLAGKNYKTGINKRPMRGPVPVDSNGLQDDAICNRKYHGGPDQAVYVEGSVSLDWWEKRLGVPCAPGLFGENLVVRGLDNAIVAAGDRFLIDDVLLEATAPRMPCATFAAKMRDPQFVKQYRKAERPGFYCRVLRSGNLKAGSDLSYEPYSGPRVLMTEMMKDYGKIVSGDTLTRYLTAPIHGKLRASLRTGKVKF